MYYFERAFLSGFGSKPSGNYELSEAPISLVATAITSLFLSITGDGRVNEQTVLAMVHTLMAREHNRIAEELANINPHWNDETIFQVSNVATLEMYILIMLIVEANTSRVASSIILSLSPLFFC